MESHHDVCNTHLMVTLHNPRHKDETFLWYKKRCSDCLQLLNRHCVLTSQKRTGQLWWWLWWWWWWWWQWWWLCM